jgi:hypothetical protein
MLRENLIILIYKFFDLELTEFKDLNPIEWVWNDLKYFLCTEIQPQNLKELVNGVKFFWKTYCNSKINHLEKVINKVISVTGRASRY